MEIEEYLNKIKALGDLNRLRVYCLVLKSPGLCVCELSDILEIKQYNVSRCLKELKNAGLVNEQREGRWISYAPTFPESEFHKLLKRAVENIKEEVLSPNQSRFLERVSLRQDGKCVIGINFSQKIEISKEGKENA
ncbi:MAG: metalloregulator ArsR/SmtB family transcription factor [Caldisericota bacterium]|nr:metalloregulator ArsR/SmtB family transcription factor [Caldisericota bacterium]